MGTPLFLSHDWVQPIRRNKMDLFDKFETNSELENDGVWLNFGCSKVQIARLGGSNVEWIKQYSDEVKKLGKTGLSSLDFIEQRELERRIFCNSVIKSHQVKDETGEFVDGILIKKDNKKEIVPFNTENLMLCFEQLPEYYLAIKDYADDYKTFLNSQVEKQEKNS